MKSTRKSDPISPPEIARASSYMKAEKSIKDAKESLSEIGSSSNIYDKEEKHLSELEKKLKLLELDANDASKAGLVNKPKKFKFMRNFGSSPALDQMQFLVDDIEKVSNRIGQIGRLSKIRRKPVQVLYDFYETHNLPPVNEGPAKLLNSETPLFLQDPNDEVTTKVPEIIPWSDLYSVKYEKTGPLSLNLVGKVINFAILSQKFPSKESTEFSLPRLGSLICYLTTNICNHMRDCPDDSEFHTKIIHTVDCIIDRLKSLICLESSSSNNLYLLQSLEICFKELQNELPRLSERNSVQLLDTQEPNDFPELSTKPEIRLVINDEERTYPKCDITFENLETIIFEELRIPVQKINDINFDGYQGSGSYGYVYEGTSGDQKVAIKLLKEKEGLPDWHRCLRIIREVYTWWRADGGQNTYIHQFIGICTLDKNRIGLVSPWCREGNMYQYLAGRDIRDALKLASQVSIGLQYLHSLRIVHGDLRSDNVLICEGEARLVDFGLSHVLDDAAGFTTETHGNEAWLAPEILSLKYRVGKPTYPSDIFSFGRLLFASLTGKYPYEGRTRADICNVVLNNPTTQPTDLVPLPDPRLKDCLKLMHYCWVSKAVLRPSADYVKMKMSEIVLANQNVELGYVPEPEPSTSSS